MSSRKSSLLSALTLLLTFGIIGVASPAFASTEDKSVVELTLQEVDNDSVVTVADGKLTNMDLLRDADIEYYSTIAAIDSGTLKDYSPEELSSIVLDSMNVGPRGTNFLVVNTDGVDEIYVTSDDPELELAIESILGANDEGVITSEDAGFTLLLNSEDIYSAMEEVSSSSVDPGPLLLWTFGSMAVVGLIIAVCYQLTSRYSKFNYWRRSHQAKKQKKKLAKEKLKLEKAAAKAAAEKEKKRLKEEAAELKKRAATAAPVTELITELLNKLKETARKTEETDPELSSAISGTIDRFLELREALTLMEASEVKRKLLFLEYEKTLEQLVELSGPKYYEDIKQHPTHWRNPDEKLTAIVACFVETNNQILESIIQLKEGSDFEFQLSIERILGFKITSAAEMLNPQGS